MTAEELHYRIKKMIIETLKIQGVVPDDIRNDEMIFESEQLNLDSLDGLELVMAIQKEFSVTINDQSHAHTILQTVNSIAEFVQSQQGSQAVA